MSFEIRNFDIQTMSKFEFVRVEIHFSRLVTIENLNCSCIYLNAGAGAEFDSVWERSKKVPLRVHN